MSPSPAASRSGNPPTTRAGTGSPAASPRHASRWTTSCTGSAGLRSLELRHQLLLVVAGVLSRRVVGLHGRRIGDARTRVDAEVVADEAARAADAFRPWRRKLGIPRMR